MTEREKLARVMAPGERVEWDSGGQLDEIVALGGAHLERMSKRSWFLNCIRADGSSLAIWLDGIVTMTEERGSAQRPLPAPPAAGEG
jgi:hypothetical protein